METPHNGSTLARSGPPAPRQSSPRERVPADAGSGLLEAPSDGRTYVRNGATASWELVPLLPYVIPEAPADGQGYTRVGTSQQWRPAFTQHAADALYAPRSTASFPEAPQDGIAYARRGWDHAWIPVATGQGVTEAPVDGYLYVRRGSDESWQLAFTKAQADSLYAPITQISETPPVNPYPGDLWFDPVDRALYIYYDDGSRQQDNGAGSIPEAPTDGQLYDRHGADQNWQPVAAAPTSMTVTTAGTHPVPPGTGLVFVNVAGAVTLTLPASGSVKVMDRGPHAASFPITVQPPAGKTINGSATWGIATDWGVANVTFDGANYAVG